MNEKVTAVIPAGGVGKRFGSDKKKQFFSLNEKPIIYYTLASLMRAFEFSRVIIGAAPEDFSELEDICNSLQINNYSFSPKGSERFHTVYNAMKYCNTDYVLIHDAVRPCVDKNVVIKTIEKAFETGAAVCGIKPSDTVKTVHNGKITETLDRETLLLTHTPQCFKREIIMEGLENVFKKDLPVTDDSSAVELTGYPVAVVESNPENIKITRYSDLDFLKKYLKSFE